MPPPSEPDPLRASDARFHRQRAELVEALHALLGPRSGLAPLDDPDRAVALAAGAASEHREARERGWAVVRSRWPPEARTEVTTFLHEVGDRLGARAVWLIVPGREPQAAAVGSEMVLDNPLGFAALAGGELVLLDHELPAGLWLAGPAAGADGWRLEVWGTEPWLSATTRALRNRGAGPPLDEPGA